MTTRRRGLLAALLLLALASCSLVRSLGTTETAMEEAGYHVEALEVVAEYGRGTVVAVTWHARAETAEALEEEAAGAARVVWEELEFRVDLVELSPVGPNAGLGVVTFPRAELERRFGPRRAELDRRRVSEAFDPGPVWLAFRFVVVVAVPLAAFAVWMALRAWRRDSPGRWDPAGGEAGPHDPFRGPGTPGS